MMKLHKGDWIWLAVGAGVAWLLMKSNVMGNCNNLGACGCAGVGRAMPPRRNRSGLRLGRISNLPASMSNRLN